jgi:hypothetical protein
MATKQKQVSLYKGKRLRVTELDYSGRPVYGADSVIVTNGMVTVGFTGNVVEGDALSGTNANGDICWSEPSSPKFSNYSVEATFCDVDFALFEKLTGHPVVLNDDGTIVGITEESNIDLANINFALELWTGASSSTPARTGAQGEWGYILAPFLRGGTVTDISVENAAITFGVTGMVTKDGAAWGKGPYQVELVAGVPAVLNKALTAKSHRRTMSVEIAPPVAFTGPVPLLDPTKPALTAITATVTGKSVVFAPTPAGTDPVWYDFGDGQWDYAETGSYTHVYATAGTFTATAKRGTSTVTKSVTTV